MLIVFRYELRSLGSFFGHTVKMKNPICNGMWVVGALCQRTALHHHERCHVAMRPYADNNMKRSLSTITTSLSISLVLSKLIKKKKKHKNHIDASAAAHSPPRPTSTFSFYFLHPV